jgi:hypothetical protein
MFLVVSGNEDIAYKKSLKLNEKLNIKYWNEYF